MPLDIPAFLQSDSLVTVAIDSHENQDGPHDPTGGRRDREATDLGRLGDPFLVEAFHGREELSRLFGFQLELLSRRRDLAPEEVVGKRTDITLRQADGTRRHFNGFINRFTGGEPRLQGHTAYTADVAPWLWFLTRSADCRIFQNKSVPEILEQVFQDFGFQDYSTRDIRGAHPKLEYCVQYRETAFNFVSRLMEQSGIFYFFVHEPGKHTLVLADQNRAFAECPEAAIEVLDGALAEDHIHSWRHRFELRSGRWTQDDYDFKKPSLELQTSEPALQCVPQAKGLEVYDYPGLFVEKPDGRTLTRRRMESEELRHDNVLALSSNRSLFAGGTFVPVKQAAGALGELDGAFEQGRSFAITAIEHRATNALRLAGHDGIESYSNAFTCIPESVAYRPERVTTKPVVVGSQTAVVVGPEDEEIHTDEYGRIKVQFHWDRRGEFDEKSSCWIRVSQAIAGHRWGAIMLPRIGQEVVITFEEGDPDRPLITGCVYNGEHMPPYELPDNKTQMGLKTRSTTDGTPESFNELRFEDKKGKEQVYLHAERNLDVVVEANETRRVGWDRSTTIHHDDSLTVTKGNREIKILEGDHSLLVQLGDTSRSTPVGTDTTFAKSIVLNALSDITLVCGASMIKLTPAMITISSPLVKIN